MPRTILIVGAGGGVGAALTAQAAHRYPQSELTAWSRQRPQQLPVRTTWAAVDVTNEETIAAAAANLQALDLVIVATGLLHRDSPATGAPIRPEKTWRTLDAASMADVFAINAIGPALVAKHVLGKLPRDRRAVFAALSARVGSISDNRLGGWHSYRAAKAALNQIIQTLSIELAARYPHAVCVGLHPGTVATALSAPFRANVTPEKLFASDIAANHLLTVLETLTPADTGGCFDWAGQRIAP